MIGIEDGQVVTHEISYAWEGTKKQDVIELYRMADILSR